MSTTRRVVAHRGASATIAAVAAVSVLHGVYIAVLPSVDPEHWRAYTLDPELLDYLGDEFRSSGGFEVAFGLMAVSVAILWLRTGDVWAWRTLWLLPALLLWLAAHTWLAPLLVVLSGVCGVALIAARPRTAADPAATSADR